VAGAVAGDGTPVRRGSGKIAAADGPAGVMSDIGTPAERAMASAMRDAEMIGYEGATRVPATEDGVSLTVIGKHGFGWKLFDALGFHKGGAVYNLFNGGSGGSSSASNYVVTYGSASSQGSGRAQAEIANAQLGQRLFSSIGSGASYLYRGTIGPNTAVGRYIIKPVDDIFYGGLGLIANSPLGDAGTIATLETSGVPLFSAAGEGLAGVRGLASLGGTLRVAQNAKILSVADDPLAIATGRLLPGEGMVGTYDDLIAAGVKGDNITPHHIPSANRMALEEVSQGDGIAINMEQPFPGVGGRHRATFTYGTQADIAMTPRDALAAGVWDARQIYRADGLYTPQIRSSLQELIQMNKANHPIIFVK
jgi:hypothetical protein